jgi:prepilin-type N-terminal cleavage/methylation domain-containing protein
MSKNIMQKLKSQLGFTMIELLIVITILGILAVAVLSAINPIEQINRGRDTGSQSDTEQFLSAVDRYNAFQGYYPWQLDADDTETSIMGDNPIIDGVSGDRITDIALGLPVQITLSQPCTELSDPTDDACTIDTDCPIVDRLSSGDEDIDATSCRGAQELKDSFITRLSDASTRSLYIYHGGTAGGSTYVCFVPQSGAFETAASDRCDNDTTGDPGDWTYGAGLPEDIGAAARVFICDPATDRDADGNEDEASMVCLP